MSLSKKQVALIGQHIAQLASEDEQQRTTTATFIQTNVLDGQVAQDVIESHLEGLEFQGLLCADRKHRLQPGGEGEVIFQAIPEANRKPYDHVGAIMDFEDGSLPAAETLTLFQYLVNTGLAFQLQGAYGRAAHHLLQAGHINAR